MASDAPYGDTQVFALNGLHAEATRSEGRGHIAKLHLKDDRGLTTNIEADHQVSNFGLAEQDAVVLTTDVKIILADVHTACNVRESACGGEPVYGHDDQHRSNRATSPSS